MKRVLEEKSSNENVFLKIKKKRERGIGTCNLGVDTEEEWVGNEVRKLRDMDEAVESPLLQIAGGDSDHSYALRFEFIPTESLLVFSLSPYYITSIALYDWVSLYSTFSLRLRFTLNASRTFISYMLH